MGRRLSIEGRSTWPDGLDGEPVSCNRSKQYCYSPPPQYSATFLNDPTTNSLCASSSCGTLFWESHAIVPAMLISASGANGNTSSTDHCSHGHDLHNCYLSQSNRIYPTCMRQSTK